MLFVFSVSALRGLGLTVVPDEQEKGPAGHALIPELSLAAYERNKKSQREIQVRLAELASASVVYYPEV
jgi:hypothetical protein